MHTNGVHQNGSEPRSQNGEFDIDSLNQLFQDQLLVSQVPQSVWGVLLSLSPDDYKTVLLERTKQSSRSSTGSSPTRSTSNSSAVPKFGYHIGRHKSCDIRIQNPHISNHHCLIYRVESGSMLDDYEDSGNVNDYGAPCQSRVYLEDTSTNGTYVNGKKVGKNASVELQDGDEIQLVRYQPSKGMAYFNDSFYRFQNLEVHRQERCLFKQNYLLSDHLGKGAFAEVKVAINRVTGQRYAAKIIDRNKITRIDKRKKLDENFRIETSILSRVRHPSIVQVHGVFKERDRLYLVLDLAADGELFDEIVRREFLSEDDTRKVLLQLLLAIKHLNCLGIVHRDIKLENILLSDKEQLRIKLADFGLAKIVDEQMFMKTVCGTPMYVAPEVLTVRQLGMYDNQVDMWSLGVVLYICLCGFPPFSDELSPPPMRDQIIAGMYNFPSPHWDSVSSSAIDLVCAMLQVDPRQRITVDGALAHPWLRAKRVGSVWSIEGIEGFTVSDPDSVNDSQLTQSLTVESSQQLSQPWSAATSAAAQLAHIYQQFNGINELPPSSPPVGTAPAVAAAVAAVADSAAVAPPALQDSEVVIMASVSNIEGCAHVDQMDQGDSYQCADIGDEPNGAAAINRKRKDRSFLMSQSDMAQMLTAKRSMHFHPNEDSQTSGGAHTPASAHTNTPPAAIPSADSDIVVPFEMSPEMSRRPSCEQDTLTTGTAASSYTKYNSSNNTRPGTACPLLIYPKAIPRPGAQATVTRNQQQHYSNSNHIVGPTKACSLEAVDKADECLHHSTQQSSSSGSQTLAAGFHFTNRR
ncbi:serine/threonine protein kinase [Dipsacomyces acuminosporus]|nr:serine/threonine protein kinase [Dipsacomyces acuminosporus]